MKTMGVSLVGFQGRQRASRFYDELAAAISHMDAITLKAWGKRSGKRVVYLAAKRVGGLAQLAAMASRFGIKELMGLMTAVGRGTLLLHIEGRSIAAKSATLEVGREGIRVISKISKALIRDPKSNAPRLLGTLLGFSLGSGGLNGNGGIPDLDLMAGIDAHRSPLTHSIIAGIIFEVVLLAFVDLAVEIHSYLPEEHDPLWDSLVRVGRPLAENLVVGTSAGIAYHLMIDAFVQPGTYHGLPVSLPIEGHQAVFAANGVAEGAHGGRAARRHYQNS